MDRSKDRKESAVSLMKRLTNIKRSKSPTSVPPSTPNYSMDNPVFEDTVVTNSPSMSVAAQQQQQHTSSGKRTTAMLSHPVHVRYCDFLILLAKFNLLRNASFF